MAGTKTNERPGTRAKASYVRSSAYKAREILNLIRGKSVAEAAEILQFSERGISEDILKVLDSAVANAEHNDNQVADELFVSACYADEGPTLKRFRPRARGRASRIRKRTCHITVIVSRLDDEAIEQARASASGSTQAADARAARVAQSKAAQGDDVEETVADEAVVEEAPVEEAAAEETEAPTAAEMHEDGVEYDGTVADSDGDDIVDADDATPFGDGSHAPLADPQEMPDGFPIKGNMDSMKFHQPGGRWYDNTVAEVWFATPEAAEAAGFVEAGKRAKKADEEKK